MAEPESFADEVAPLRAFCAAMCDAAAPTQVTADLPGFLAGHGVNSADQEAIAGHAKRLLLYRKMVHSRLRGVVEDFLPRTAEHLGKPRLRAEITAFMAERAPHTVYFREIPGEFLAWAVPRWRADPDLPAFLVDLARHEWLDGEVSNSVRGGESASGIDLAIDRPVQLDGSVQLRRYDFAVQRDDEPPVREATAILGYRDRESHRVRLLELTPRAAAVCGRLLAGETLQAALAGACADLGEALSDEFLAAMAGFFADLGERGVLLGAAG
jgi:hypothetical protein